MFERPSKPQAVASPSRARMESLLRVYSNPAPTSPAPVQEEPVDERPRAFAAPVYARSIGRDRYLLFRSKMLSRSKIVLCCRESANVPFIPGITILELTVMLHGADASPLRPERVTLLAKYARFIEESPSDASGMAPGLELSIVQAAPEDASRWQSFLASL